MKPDSILDFLEAVNLTLGIILKVFLIGFCWAAYQVLAILVKHPEILKGAAQ